MLRVFYPLICIKATLDRPLHFPCMSNGMIVCIFRFTQVTSSPEVWAEKMHVKHHEVQKKRKLPVFISLKLI